MRVIPEAHGEREKSQTKSQAFIVARKKHVPHREKEKEREGLSS